MRAYLNCVPLAAPGSFTGPRRPCRARDRYLAGERTALVAFDTPFIDPVPEGML